MDSANYLRWTRADGDRLAAAADLGMDAPVPSCPGWSVADLVAHAGVVHRHKVQIIAEGWMDGMPEPVDPPETGLIVWYREGLGVMLEVLADHDPAEPIATWLPEDQTVGFWYRRMACETVVHRIDAELAHGVVTPVDAELAADGIDEILSIMMTGYPDWSDFRPTDHTIRLETTDTGHHWTLRAGLFSGTSPNTGTTYGDEPTYVLDDVVVPDTVITGEAEDLFLYLWGRRPDDGLTVAGDADDVAKLRTLAADSTQ